MQEEQKIEEETQTEHASESESSAVAESTESVASTTDAEAVNPAKKISAFDRFFKITASGSTFKTEIIAGVTTFMAMVYALIVVPGMYGKEMFDAVYIATALGAIIGTTIMALYAKMPLAQASGLGATAYITGTLLSAEMGLTYANAMIFVLLDGIIFVLLTATGLRKKILAAIPDEVKISIPVGIGMFIALIGFKSAGVVLPKNGFIGFASFNVLSGLTYSDAIGAALALVGVIAIAVLSAKKINGSILWGMLGTTILYFAFVGLGCAWKDEKCLEFFRNFSVSNPLAAFASWGKQSAGQVFANGFDFSEYLGVEGHSVGTLVVLILTSALSLCMIDMFDTLGTLYGACSKGGLLDKDGTPLRLNQCMLSDAVATCVGAVSGATTVTTYIEASSGVAAGGKTGFAALVTAIGFLVATFLSPVAQLIPSCATAAALIWVGVLMMSSVKNIHWTDATAALPAFLTIAVMAFGFSIAFGIGIGLISCVAVKVCTGKMKQISAVTWVLAVLFLALFLFTN